MLSPMSLAVVSVLTQNCSLDGVATKRSDGLAVTPSNLAHAVSQHPRHGHANHHRLTVERVNAGATGAALGDGLSGNNRFLHGV